MRTAFIGDVEVTTAQRHPSDHRRQGESDCRGDYSDDDHGLVSMNHITVLRISCCKLNGGFQPSIRFVSPMSS